MKIVELDAANWTKELDFYNALLPALGAPQGHGYSTDALVDSMIWGGMNKLEPPYTVRIRGVEKLSEAVLDEIESAKKALSKGREYFRTQKGRDVEVSIETIS